MTDPEATAAQAPAQLTRAERAVKARTEAAERERERIAAERAEASRIAAAGGRGVAVPCPFDRTSPEGIRWLLDRALAVAQSILDDPASTNQDRLAALGHLRQASGLGKDAPDAPAYQLDMDSMLGGVDEVVPDETDDPKVDPS